MLMSNYIRIVSYTGAALKIVSRCDHCTRIVSLVFYISPKSLSAASTENIK